MTLRSELFPAPFGPMMARICPCVTAKLTSRRAATPPKARLMPSSARMGSAAVLTAERAAGARVGAAGREPGNADAFRRVALESAVMIVDLSPPDLEGGRFPSVLREGGCRYSAATAM